MKLNESRTDEIEIEEGDKIFRKENRRNKITPRFTIHKVSRVHGPTFKTSRGQKIHKSKIRKTTKKQKDN